MSFVQRAISVTFQLDDGSTFAGTSSSNVTVSGLRVHATIMKSGPPAMGQTQLRIFGLSDSLMKQLSTYGLPVNLATGVVAIVTAGDEEGGMSIVSKGTVQSAWADYDQMPEVCFNVSVYEGYFAGLKAIPPTSINGAADAAQIMGSLAKAMGYAFENNGVSVQLAYPYFAGDARTQADQCAEAGDFNWFIETDTLAIWPRSGTRAGGPVLISPDTGMVGYPTFMPYGVVVRTLLNPSVKYGTLIQVQSSLKAACGQWGVIEMVTELQSETPDGAWFTTIKALRPNYVETVNQVSTLAPRHIG